MSRETRQAMKPRSFEHIASAIIPSAGIIAVPSVSNVFPSQKNQPTEEWANMGQVILRASLVSEQLVPARSNSLSESDDDDDDEQEETSTRRTKSTGRIDASTDDDSDDSDDGQTHSHSKTSTATKSSSTPKKPTLTVTERRLFGHEDQPEKSQSTTADPGLSSTIRLDAKPAVVAPPAESVRSTTTTTTTSSSDEPNQRRAKVTVTRQFVPPLVINPIISQTNPSQSQLSTRADTIDSEVRSSLNDSMNIPNTARSVSFKEPVVAQTYEPSSSKSSTTVVDRTAANDLLKENLFLREENEKLQKINRKQQEEFRQQLQSSRSFSESEMKTFLKDSGQEQLKQLEELYEKSQERCKQLQNELNVVKGEKSPRPASEQLKTENEFFKKEIYRLNVALSDYQKRFPSETSGRSKIEGLPRNGTTPIWLIDQKFLSPLFVYYDQQIEEKNEFIHEIQKRCEDLENQIRLIVNENRSTLPVDLERIKQQAQLVLEENQLLQDKLTLQSNELIEMRKNQSEEILNLNRRLIVAEREKVDHERTIETMRMKNDDLRRQIDRFTIENDQRIDLNVHLTEIDELKRLLDELKEKHRSETELLLRRVHDAETGKKEAQMKVSDQRNDLQRMQDELKQMKKVKRKLEVRIETFEKKLELEKFKEQQNLSLIEKLRQDKQIELQRNETDEQIEQLKEKLDAEKKRSDELESTIKSNKKHVEQIQNLSKKQIDQLKSRCSEYEIRLQQLSTILAEKQIRIDGFSAEQRNFEIGLEQIWLTSNADNKRMHEQLRDMRIVT